MTHNDVRLLSMLEARLDRIPDYTPRMRWLIVLLALMFGFDLVDIQSFALAAPALQREWGIGSEQIGLLQSMVFVGGLLGAAIGGPLADRVGRRPVALAAVLLFSLGSLASAFAPSPEILAILRVVTGIGVTAATTSILVLASEMFPAALRGRSIAIITFSSVLIIPVLTVVSNAAVPSGHWHLIFLFGSLGLLLLVPAFWLLPESPRWAASHGRESSAERTVALFERQYQSGGRRVLPEPGPVQVPAPSGRPPMWIVFTPPYLRRTLVATVIFVGLALLNTGLNSWFPVILDQRGHPLDQVYGWLVILSLGGLVGPLLATFVIELMERRWLVFIGAAITGTAYLFLGFIDEAPVILVAGLVAAVASSMLSTAVFTYTPEIFPTAIRGLGAGVSQGASRIATIANALAIGLILGTSTDAVFVYLAVVTVIICVMAVLGPDVGVRAARMARRAARAARRK